VFFLLESAEPSSRWPSINPLLKNKVHISAARKKLVNKVKEADACCPARELHAFLGKSRVASETKKPSGPVDNIS